MTKMSNVVYENGIDMSKHGKIDSNLPASYPIIAETLRDHDISVLIRLHISSVVVSAVTISEPLASDDPGSMVGIVPSAFNEMWLMRPRATSICRGHAELTTPVLLYVAKEVARLLINPNRDFTVVLQTRREHKNSLNQLTRTCLQMRLQDTRLDAKIREMRQLDLDMPRRSTNDRAELRIIQEQVGSHNEKLSSLEREQRLEREAQRRGEEAQVAKAADFHFTSIFVSFSFPLVADLLRNRVT
ncbi:MAG: hypothetical protein M1833_003537 [Piccolia ochrophora]|nr:MAG: hypothetical protein M1833_003537 [Piccolia ochrophora]